LALLKITDWEDDSLKRTGTNTSEKRCASAGKDVTTFQRELQTS